MKLSLILAGVLAALAGCQATGTPDAKMTTLQMDSDNTRGLYDQQNTIPVGDTYFETMIGRYDFPAAH